MDGDVLIDHFRQYFHGLNFNLIQKNQYQLIEKFSKLENYLKKILCLNLVKKIQVFYHRI